MMCCASKNHLVIRILYFKSSVYEPETKVEQQRNWVEYKLQVIPCGPAKKAP